jgi:hypothetical protein
MCRWLITELSYRTGSGIEGFSLQVQSLLALPIFNFSLFRYKRKFLQAFSEVSIY